MKVVVGGPPHSGKSTFTATLIEYVRRLKRENQYNISFNYDPLDITDNSLPYLLDETGEVPQRHDVEWDIEKAEQRRNLFAGRDHQLVLADAPGKLTNELDIVISPADMMIILASDEKSDKIPKWEQRAKSLDIEVGWIITTTLDSAVPAGWADFENWPRKGVIQSIRRDDFRSFGLSAYGDSSNRVVRQTSIDLIKRATP